jgi:hypothetical protein
MSASEKPGPFELWQQAGGDGARYRRLMRQHGHLLGTGDEGYEDAPRNLPCGWPENRGPTETTHECPPNEGGLMPCCGLTPFEVPLDDRITEDPALVTCPARVTP